jgi:hypothetical protein
LSSQCFVELQDRDALDAICIQSPTRHLNEVRTGVATVGDVIVTAVMQGYGAIYLTNIYRYSRRNH